MKIRYNYLKTHNREKNDEGVNEIHGMNETHRNRCGIYSNKRHKLGDIILKFKILNKNY